MTANSKRIDNSNSLESIEGGILDVDYVNKDGIVYIRLIVKGTDGKGYEIIDTEFRPYFYFLPEPEMSDEEIMNVKAILENNTVIKPTRIAKSQKKLFGKVVNGYKIFVAGPSDVPKLSTAMAMHGKCYEYDIPFAKRYVIDKGIVPIVAYTVDVEKKDDRLVLKSMALKSGAPDANFSILWFDIEVYNPLGIPRGFADPVIMISYSYSDGKDARSGVITTKKIDKPYVEVVKDEKALLKRFMSIVQELDVDIISGYNSANFDIRYMIERANALKIDFSLGRYDKDTRIERHGLVDRVKISGRVHVDMYLVVRFIAIVGASEYILKLNSYTLKNVYEAISKDKKITVEKKEIYKLWDGGKEDLEALAEYNLNDSFALMKVYSTFMPIIIELCKTSRDMITDVSVSSSGQLVEFMLMCFAQEFGELIPNRPDENEIRVRTMNPIEGAYVKTPDPGIYDNLAVFDFRGLYPSIIISHNIDPSSLCEDCKNYYESPTGAKFNKDTKNIMPAILKLLIEQRTKVKAMYKKDPGNVSLGSRSLALKIISNSFYGYLGYPRSRYYSRDCAASVTAYGRQYIKDTIAASEQLGFRVIYGDTDSIVMLLGDQKKENALSFMKGINTKLPESMELELEDFYTRGVFVGKKTDKESAGAKKKYALLSESGRIKIRGFELVRRDWSRIARDTQMRVLETILKEGSKEKAGDIVKDVIKRLKDGKVPLSELVINTQLRKSIDSYDSKSPELSAAKKAVESGAKTRDEVEHGVIGYVITKHGNTISERAELEETAKDYDPEYYIDHQVLPATMRILKELDFNEDELRGDGVQRKLW